nr:hypothetical protein [Tanacetum cinerariifolium]
MIVILEKYEHNINFHQIVDFVKASHIRYALTINPTVYVSHIQQFWSTARIETTDAETKILATVDGKPRTISKSSIRRNLKLNNEAGISSLPDVELFKNLALIGKEKMVELDTPKKKKLQEQIDVQMAREMEEQMAREDQRMNEQITRVCKILKSHSGWKTKHFKDMTLKEIREKFIPVWKQIKDFIPMASKEEGERVKRKGLRLAFCDYHNMIAILEKSEHNVDFHQIVDFVEASHIRIETTNEGTKIFSTVDGKPKTISESSIRRNLKLNDKEGISTLPDAELFENLVLMGYNILPNQKFTFQKGQFSHQW